MAHLMTDERIALRDAAREFAMGAVLPIANELDPIKGDIPMAMRDQLAELGYFAILIPEEHGGLGLGVVEYALVTEELARAWMSVASIIRSANGFTPGFSDELKVRYLPRMARGELLGAFALSEPDVGSDAAAITCRAVRDGDDWVVNGAKMWCTFADGADFIVLFARTAPPSDGKRHLGISAFLIEKERDRFPEGIHASAMPKIGYFGWKTFELAFEDFRIPAANLLGEEGRAFYTAMVSLDVARVHTAARAVGLARGALEDSLRYARERVQFGQPIAEFQAIRFKLAEMASEIEAARQLTLFAAASIDEGRRCDKEAAMAKLFASDMAERVTSEAIQIHGGAGYTTDFAVERYWRDARLTRIFEGTSEIQKRVISDRLLKEAA